MPKLILTTSFNQNFIIGFDIFNVCTAAIFIAFSYVMGNQHLIFAPG